MLLSQTIVLRRQMMSPTLVQFVWDYAKSGSLVCPFSLLPKECKLALDYFGFGGLDIIIADDDPGKIGKDFAYSVFKNTMKSVPVIIAHVKQKLQANKVARGLHFIVAPPAVQASFVSSSNGDFCLLDHYRAELPLGYEADRLTFVFQKGIGRFDAYGALSPDDDDAADARTAVLAGVLAFGGMQAEWSNTKRMLNVGDVGEHGNREYVSALCHVLVVEPSGRDGVAEAQGILSVLSDEEEEEQDAPKSKSKRKRKD